MKKLINWSFFPKTDPLPEVLNDPIKIFEKNHRKIDSTKNDTNKLRLSSDKVLKVVEENLGIFYQNNIRFLILDTYKKNNQNLTSFYNPSKIKDLINKCSVKKINVGLAGRLQPNHITKLKLLNPYVIGFRSAICSDQNRKFLSEKKLIFLSNQFFSNKSNAIESAGA